MSKKDLSTDSLSNIMKKYHAVLSEIGRLHCFRTYYEESGNQTKLEQVIDLIKRLEAAEAILSIEIDKREEKWNA